MIQMTSGQASRTVLWHWQKGAFLYFAPISFITKAVFGKKMWLIGGHFFLWEILEGYIYLFLNVFGFPL